MEAAAVSAHPGSKRSPESPQKSRSLPWFRLYNEFAGDPNIQSLPFDDQRHFVVLMCLKSAGVLDRAYASEARRDAVIARGLSLPVADAAAARDRLREAGLIVGEWEPKGWADRQFESDDAAKRQRDHRAKKGLSQPCHVTVASQDED